MRLSSVLWLIAVCSVIKVSADQAASLVGRVLAVGEGDTFSVQDDAKFQCIQNYLFS